MLDGSNARSFTPTEIPAVVTMERGFTSQLAVQKLLIKTIIIVNQSPFSGGNLLAVPPINKTVLEGEEAQFDCLAKDLTVKIKWFKDNIPLEEYHDLMQRSWITKDNTLVIHPTDLGDYGEYECEASNDIGEKQLTRAFLNVQCNFSLLYLFVVFMFYCCRQSEGYIRSSRNLFTIWKASFDRLSLQSKSTLNQLKMGKRWLFIRSLQHSRCVLQTKW